MGHPTVLALTATASPPVREEIVERLHMHDPLVVVKGFDRPNIWLGVEHFHEESKKRRALIEATRAADKPGLVYTATRRSAEELAGDLGAATYHAGMTGKKRDQIQNDFMDDKVDTIVATTAFGMGIDKPNIRFVHHHDTSESVDSYYRELGRAGRDGEPARAVLFYRAAEEERHAFDRSRVEMIRAYAEHPGCRRQFILSYFGEDYEGPCGNCDNCDAGHGDATAVR
jgi:ATP-dependent DNA helicase RecQ